MSIVSFRVLGPVEVRGQSRAGRPEGPAAPGRARPPADRPRPGRAGRPPGRRPLGRARPTGARGTVQTFVGGAAQGPGAGPAAANAGPLLVTVPPGYALRPEPGAVDAWRFEAAVAEAAGAARHGRRGAGWTRRSRSGAARRTRSSPSRTGRGRESAGWTSCGCSPWSAGPRRRSALGRAAEAVPDLEAHVAAHPLREDGWRLLAAGAVPSGPAGRRAGALRRARRAAGQRARAWTRAERCGSSRPTSSPRPRT